MSGGCVGETLTVVFLAVAIERRWVAHHTAWHSPLTLTDHRYAKDSMGAAEMAAAVQDVDDGLLVGGGSAASPRGRHIGHVAGECGRDDRPRVVSSAAARYVAPAQLMIVKLAGALGTR